MNRIPLVFVGLTVAIGCDGDHAVAEFPRGCDQSTLDGDCIEYVGEGWTEPAVGAQCDSGSIVEVCPDGALGTCALDSDTLDATVSYFYPAFWQGTQAAMQCVARGGTWTDR